ncbi:hypothetical protein FSP39_003584 [Pinctada imbricata]|uniref:Uncharacterized protein n=1 Tax=Pinctada imbricata TaxID=66713 RepID=A0AA89BK56_PINIB|nr:hypothetical protein FSP39_003584 [Pinctada imbricata]
MLVYATNCHMDTSLYNKRDFFNFSITNIPFLSSNIPSSPAYGVFISQFIRYARAITKYTYFVLKARRLSDKLLSQGYVCDRLTSSQRKFDGRYRGLVIHYDVPLSRMNVEARLETPSIAKYGEDFTVSLTGINRTDEEQLIHGTVSCKPENYAAEELGRIKFKDIDGIIPPKAEDGKVSLEVVVTVDDYMGRLHDGCYISVVGVIFNNTTLQASLIERTIRLIKPDLKVEIVEDSIEVNKDFYVIVSFTNPLNVPLTDCEIDIDAKGISIQDAKAMKPGKVGPRQEFSHQIKLKARNPGFRRLGAVFNAAEMYDIAGNTWLYVTRSN